MSYAPAPGSVAFRVLAHLESLPPGAERMTSQLAEALGVEGVTISPCMDAALKNGLVRRRQRDAHVRSPGWWSLVDQRNTPKGANRDATGFEGRGSQEPDATDCEARSKVMAPDGSESPTGRGTNGAPALGAAPVFTPEPEGAAAIAGGPATAEETSHRGNCQAYCALAPRAAVAADDARPAVGAAAPEGLRVALWSDGTLQLERAGSATLRLSRDETRALVRYLDSIALDAVRAQEVA